MEKLSTTIELNLLRRLALMQHLGEDYFFVNGVAYEGEEDEAKANYDEHKEEVENITDQMSFAEFVAENFVEVEELEPDDYTVDYMVLTDDEADEKWDESLDNYIDECILPLLPDNLQMYFDDEKWKRDARIDGRGHSLSSYDGNEDEETVEGVTFYIYRTN